MSAGRLPLGPVLRPALKSRPWTRLPDKASLELSASGPVRRISRKMTRSAQRPGGDSTTGLGYSSYDAPWNGWGTNVGTGSPESVQTSTPSPVISRAIVAASPMQSTSAAHTILKTSIGQARLPDGERRESAVVRSDVYLQLRMSAMLKARKLVATIACILIVGSIPIVFGAPVQIGARRYVNRVFGFSVRIPAGRPTCGAEPDTQDTGIMIFLDRGPSDCRDRNTRASVSVNGGYNAMDAHNLPQLLSIFCGAAKPQRTSAEEFGSLGKVWPAMCRVQHGDGFSDLILVRQTPVTTVGATPWINYTAHIHAPSGELIEDLRSANAILESVRFSKPAG
jgi:hypothetical protein